MFRSLGLLLLLAGCVAHPETWDVPEDAATAEQRAQVEELKKEMEADFADAGRDLNLNQVRIIVADIGDRYAGACYKDDQGRPLAIALHPNALAHRTSPVFLPLAYTTLLHEVGHCYLNRDHETDYVTVPGQILMLDLGESSPLKRPFSRLRATVMNDDNREPLPTVLRPYYILEVLGEARATAWEDLAPFASFTIETAAVPGSVVDEGTLPVVTAPPVVGAAE